MITVGPADAETPAEWLLAEYDRQALNPRRRAGSHERPMYEVLSDVSLCGSANWPNPGFNYDLDRNVA